MNYDNLIKLVTKLRKRLLEYRYYEKGNDISIHINSIDIALCLVEFSLNTNPPRPITIEEEKWFNAGYYLDMVLRNSEWSDLIDLYYELSESIEKIGYFRK